MLTKEVEKILQKLRSCGFEAYVVGGCVRDFLLGKTPSDWDIATSATPDEVMRIFKNAKPTGLQHGTVTVEHGYEVTTFRIDGKYSDGRHPDQVVFSKDIEQDLARRDFTINAMAHDGNTFLDPFGGQIDLEKRILKCVGRARERFREDGLRIMRALRFASVYDLSIEFDTNCAIHECKDLLRNIAVERIRDELCKLLCGKAALRILMSYRDVLSLIIPQLHPCVGFAQNNPYHCFTVYDHIAHAVVAYDGSDISVKMALLLHDIGKPDSYTEDDRGGHFYGHPEISKNIAEKVMRDLRFDNATASEVVHLVGYHDAGIAPTKRSIRRWLNKIGPELFEKLLWVSEADRKSHTPGTQDKKLAELSEIRKLLKDILAENDCFSLKNLVVNGRDIIALGIPEGKRVGEILEWLLNEVIEERLENERKILLEKAQEYKTSIL